MRRLPLIMAVIAAVLVLAGCGGGSGDGGDGTSNVPESGGLRDKVRAASAPTASEFPAVEGRSLQEVADSMQGGPEVGLAGQTYTVGDNRLAFGVIDSEGKFVYGKSAVYIAPSPDAKARGPFPAPADVLVTDPAFRSRQAASENDLFAAVYGADVKFTKPGPWSVLTVTKANGGMLAAPSQVKVVKPDADPIPAVGDAAPRVQTDTVASAKGDEESIDTRVPTAPELHQESFADVAGKKPVALLFATPQLCQSRVCGPVTDIELQMKAKYGDQMTFIHQEVYVDNDPNKGLRPPLKAFKLRSEPWLFVVGADGKVTARLEGSFGLKTFENAIKTGF
ncbi:MAG TPA: hypothetical protein VFN44_02200 [Solirubrobacteraceae bacterium]|nr:hypothetical protein [Solirubrobacteraceae bacterium]